MVWLECWLSSSPSPLHTLLYLWLQPGFLSQVTSCSSDAELLHTLEEFCQPGFSTSPITMGLGCHRVWLMEGLRPPSCRSLFFKRSPRDLKLVSSRAHVFSSILVTCAHSQAPRSVLRKWARQEDLESGTFPSALGPLPLWSSICLPLAPTTMTFL